MRSTVLGQPNVTPPQRSNQAAGRFRAEVLKQVQAKIRLMHFAFNTEERLVLPPVSRAITLSS
jgi:hypothetical protein